MSLRLLFIIHASVTLAAGVVLIVMPGLIPQTVGIVVTKEAYLLCYLLAGMEVGAAFLSFYSIRIKDLVALRVISLSFIIMHMATAAVEVLAYTQGLSERIWANVALRIIVSVLFWYYGLKRNKSIDNSLS